VDDFAVVLSYEEIAAKNYSFSAGQYFHVKIEHIDITAGEFVETLSGHKQRVDGLFRVAHGLEKQINEGLSTVRYE
jgi:type I restriction enzyme M protein